MIVEQGSRQTREWLEPPASLSSSGISLVHPSCPVRRYRDLPPTCGRRVSLRIRRDHANTNAIAGIFEIICHMLGQQDVSTVPTIHHPLRDVDASAGDVRPFVHVGHFVHWAAMNAHADL